MYDSGCTSVAVLSEAIYSVGAPVFSQPCRLSTFGKDTCEIREFADFEILSMDRQLILPIKGALVGDTLTTERDQPPKNSDLIGHPYLNGVSFDELEDPTIGIILGTPFSWLWSLGETRFENVNKPIAVCSRLGWVLIGPRFGEGEVSSPGALDIALINPQRMTVGQEINRIFRGDFVMAGKGVHAEIIHPSRMDEHSLSQMLESYTFNPKSEDTRRYTFPLPYRQSRAEAARQFALADSYGAAKRRLIREKAKLLKDPARMAGAFVQMRKNLEEGSIREVKPKDMTGLPVWYSPIVIVLEPQKPIEKRYRLCQDSGAVCMTPEGPMWLNKHLCTGPDVLNSLVTILINFRQHPYVLMADIERFFYRIKVDERDAGCLRFLFFRDESLKEIAQYESPVHMFGASSSPPVANVALHQHGERVAPKYGEDIKEEILKAFYVDDYISSLQSIAIARSIRQRLSAAMWEGGFKLSKWVSNCDAILLDEDPVIPPNPNLIPSFQAPTCPVNVAVVDAPVAESTLLGGGGPTPRSISREDLLHPSPSLTSVPDGEENAIFIDNKSISLCDTVQDMIGKELFFEETKNFLKPNFNEDTKVLGVGYSKDTDMLFVRIPTQTEKEINTMTDILSIVSAYYDPLGISQPYCLEGRAIFQLCNKLRLKWKDKVPEFIKEKFLRWMENRDGLRQIQIPRWSSCWELVESLVDLVVFTDASKEAYGASVYYRRYLPDESVIVTRLMLGKGHVVPLSMHVDKAEGEEDHNESIPRLELTAARLGAELCSLMQRDTRESFENIYLFTDSTCILNWIGDLDKKFRTFEHFRLKRIWSLTEDSWWFYCPTESNPADVLTHFLSTRPKDLPRWTLYLQGPDWLRSPRVDWPRKPVVATKEVEINALYAAVDFQLEELFPARFRTRDKADGETKPTARFPSMSTPTSSLLPSHQSSSVLTFPPPPPQHSVLPHPGSGDLITETDIFLAPVDVVAFPFSRDSLRSKCFVLDLVAKESAWERKVSKIGRISKWLHHLRLFMLARRRNLEGPVVIRRYLAGNERRRAETDLIFAIQSANFKNEQLDLLTQGAFGPNSHKLLRKKNSRLTSLNPFICNNFLIRAGSRIQNASVSFDQKFPILLPSKCDNVRSLIRHEHALLGHALSQHLFGHLKLKYHILGGKSAVMAIIRQCVDCQRYDKRPTDQLMAVLPESRVNMVRPFKVTGLDMLGPLYVKHGGRGQCKRWVLLLTCTSTRAVMLFPLHDISSQAFLIALSKFQSLYPGLEEIISDQGTNFKGGESLTQSLVDQFNTELVVGELALKNVNFKFNPPNSPHMGGLFERLVRCVKRTLNFILPKAELHYEAFDAALFRCAHILNSRPLMPCGSGINDLVPLCPQNFLTPYMYGPSITFDPPITASSADLPGSWMEMRRLVGDFKVRWETEYLSVLQNRTKWHKIQTPLYDNQIVLMVENNAPRTNWNLGIITGALPSEDGLPRRYMVRMGNGKVVERHHNRLIPLELEDEMNV